MGPPRCPEPVLKDQSCLPVFASNARKRPSTSPVNTTSPPVTNSEERIGYLKGTVHFFCPVTGSKASRCARIFPSGGGFTSTLPATKDLPSRASCGNTLTLPHHSIPSLYQSPVRGLYAE